MSSEKELFKQRVKQFIQKANQKQKQLLAEKKRRHLSLQALIDSAPNLSEESVDLFFTTDDEIVVQQEVVDELQDRLHHMRMTLNDMQPEKRFYILETMNFFSSQISIGKLIPALLQLEGDDKKRVIWEFTKPTFASINNNVETLVSTDAIFDSQSIHLDRGSLYLFVSDVAKVVLRLFSADFIAEFPDIRSPVELMMQIIRASDQDAERVYHNILDDPLELQSVVMDFVAAIQSHSALYDYSLKRNAYYKHFLLNLTNPDRFTGIDVEDVSRLLAACFLMNNQRKPENALIEAMISPEKCASEETQALKREFLDNLAPTVIYKMITQFSVQLQNLSKTNVSKEFSTVHKLSVKGILKRVWTNVITTIEQSVTTVSGTFAQTFKQVKATFAAFIEEEQKSQPRPAPTPQKPKTRDVLILPKDPTCLSRMGDTFQIVTTDVAAYRGAEDGASRKDYSYNARLFKQDEATMMRFHKAFEMIFETICKNPRVQIITYKNQRKIKEYYVAYHFGTYLITFGLTHVKSSNSKLIQEKDIFPYVILFEEGSAKEFGRIMSREVEHEEKVRVYNERPLTGTNAVYYYESLYHFMHLIPEVQWTSSDFQLCVRFLVKELQQIAASEGGLLFCTGLPELGEEGN